MRSPLPLLSVILAASLPLACPGSLAVLSGDTYVSTLEKKKNFGGAPILAVGPKDQAFLQFDLSPIPSSITPAQIAKATLELWVEQVSAPGNVDVLPVGSEWSELEVNAESAPQIAQSAAGQFTISKGRKHFFTSVDITTVVQGWIANPNSNFGLALSSDGTSAAHFDSKENIATSHPPQLEIVLAGPQGIQGNQGNQGMQGQPGTPATLPSGSLTLIGSNDAIPSGYTSAGFGILGLTPIQSQSIEQLGASLGLIDSTAALGGKIYFYYASSSPLRLFALDLASGTLSAVQLPAAVLSQSRMCAGPDQALYFFGGIANSTVSTAVTRFDPVSGNSSPMADVPAMINPFDAVLGGTQIFLVGLVSEPNTFALYKFQPLTNSWGQLTGPPSDYAYGFTAASATAIYNFNGGSGMMYSLTTNQWSPMPQAPSNGGYPVSDGTNVYLVQLGSVGQVSEFNSAANMWTISDFGFIPAGLTSAGSPVIAGGVIYAPGMPPAGTGLSVFSTPISSLKAFYVSP